MKIPLHQQRIEVAIAKFWPDVNEIMKVTRCDRLAVMAVVSYLERVEKSPRYAHDCRDHPPGSPACYLEHTCRCRNCVDAHDMTEDVFMAEGRRDEAQAEIRDWELRHPGWDRSAGDRRKEPRARQDLA